ncbi:MAG: hydroxypyruvate isomerase family protein [Cyclobacteriaceae bacterium]
MNRRKFFKQGAVAAAGLSMLNHLSFGESLGSPSFKLNYAPHPGMFKHSAGDNVIDQIKFMADQGFRAMEDNDMRKRPVTEQEAMGETMERLGMTMGVFVGHNIAWDDANLAGGDAAKRDQFVREIGESISVAKRVNAKWMTVVPGLLHKKLEMGYQTANVVMALRKAAEVLEPHGLVMVLEPLNPYTDHPGLFLSKAAQAYEICKAVNSASCKILFDIYHQQITEGNLIPNIDRCWQEIAYFQVGDNPGRKEPTTGEINYKNIFKYLHQKGYTGVLGMEHGNSMEGKKGEQAVINAYRQVDGF